jgi:hypothetical protein
VRVGSAMTGKKGGRKGGRARLEVSSGRARIRKEEDVLMSSTKRKGGQSINERRERKPCVSVCL